MAKPPTTPPAMGPALEEVELLERVEVEFEEVDTLDAEEEEFEEVEEALLLVGAEGAEALPLRENWWSKDAEGTGLQHSTYVRVIYGKYVGEALSRDDSTKAIESVAS